MTERGINPNHRIGPNASSRDDCVMHVISHRLYVHCKVNVREWVDIFSSVWGMEIDIPPYLFPRTVPFSDVRRACLLHVYFVTVGLEGETTSTLQFPKKKKLVLTHDLLLQYYT